MLLSKQILISKTEEERKMTLIKDLQDIGKELTKLANQTEKLAAELGKAEKSAAMLAPFANPLLRI